MSPSRRLPIASLTIALLCAGSVLAGCAAKDGPTLTDSEPTSVTTSASMQASPSASPSQTETPKTYPSLESTDRIGLEYTESGIAYTSLHGDITMEVRSDWVLQTDGSHQLSELYFKSPQNHFVIVSNLGVPLSVAKPEEYAALMEEGSYLGEDNVSFLSDVTIDGIDAWKFTIESMADNAGETTGESATPSENESTSAGATIETARVYVFELRGEAREITVSASDEAGYRAIEEILTQKTTFHGKDPV